MFKYRCLENEYLIFDTIRFQTRITSRAVRMICSRNCGAGAAGVVEGPYMEDGQLRIRNFNPDGEEDSTDRGALCAGLCYLRDEGYPVPDQEMEFAACRIGKVFLSESFARDFL